MKRNKRKNTLAEKLCIIVLCAPAIIHLLIFWLGVQIETIRMAFTDVFTREFDLTNFEWALQSLFGDGATSDISLALRNTMIFFVVQCVMIPVSMFFAYLIFRRSFGHSYMRIALYLPGAVSGIMMALIYSKIMESGSPLMKLVQEVMHSEDPIILMVENGMLYILIFDILIGVGGNLVIWLGGMSRIPYDLIEYGKLEGVRPIREFVSVVLPLIWPTFVTMISLQVIGIFGASGSVLVLTNGQNGTYTLAFWMYQMVQMGVSNEYHHVAALGLIFTAITVPIVIVCRWFMNRFGEEVEY